jgi:L-amino acid N-acyltransferase YncA
MTIRPATVADAEACCAIYNEHVRHTIVTFEVEPLTPAEMAGRIAEKLGRYDWLVLEEAGAVVGYAYYGAFRARAAYDHSVETTIYLAENVTGRGLGRELYRALIASARDRGYRELIGVIALPNPASVALHETLGFLPIGVFPRVGYKFGRYIDVGFWQLSLEP